MAGPDISLTGSGPSIGVSGDGPSIELNVPVSFAAVAAAVAAYLEENPVGDVDPEDIAAAVAAYLAANPVEVPTVVHAVGTRTRPSLLGEAADFVTGDSFTADDMPAPVWLTGTSNGKNGLYAKSGSGATRTYTFIEYPEDGTFVWVGADQTEGGDPRLWFLSPQGFAQVYPGVGSLSDLVDVDGELEPQEGDALVFNGTEWTARTPSGGDAPLSDDVPEPLGSANSGTSPEASRADHVHPLPTPGAIGAAAASHNHDDAYQPQSPTLAALAALTLSGTPGAGNFLRGDGAWSTLPLQLVAQTVTSADAMTVQLTGLSPYKFLILMTSARGTESGTASNRYLWVQFNGDTGTTYNNMTSTATTGIAVQHLPTDGYGWGAIGLALIDNTAGVTKHLVGIGLVGASQNILLRGGLWTNTTDLISTIELSGSNVNEIAAGASFVLLGVPR